MVGALDEDARDRSVSRRTTQEAGRLVPRVARRPATDVLELVDDRQRRAEFREQLARSAGEAPTFVLASGARPEKIRPLPPGEGYVTEPVASFRKPDGRVVGRLYQARAVPATDRSGPS